MRRISTHLVLSTIFLWTGDRALAQAAAEERFLAAGVACVDITPSYPVRLNGFGGRRNESAGVRQPLFAKALAVGRTPQEPGVVVVAVDTLGIPDALTERLAARLQSIGLDRSRIAVCASHTHSAPMIRDCANTLFGEPITEPHWQHIEQYSDELEAALETVIRQAIADLQPARLEWGVGRVAFAENRRTPGGPVDHDLPVLAVKNPDGALRAVFTNYACHCVTLSDDLISGDWAGYAQDHIQRRNPGCTAMILIGCGADANPRGGVQGDRADAAEALGQELAVEVQRVLEQELTPLTQLPVATVKRVDLPLAPLPSRERWLELAAQDGAVGHHARTQLGRLDRGEGLMTSISYPVQTIAFGNELAWVFLPGEVVVDYSLRLKRELDGGRVWVHAYANACPGYVPSERVLTEGGYEGGGAMIYYDIPGPYAAGLEQTIVSAVREPLDVTFQPLVDVTRTDGVRPQSPAEALRSFRVPPGYRVELVAAEPLVQSPVAVAFGYDGRVWVAEMRDYPQPEVSGKGGGAIRCLIDDDNDGRYDRFDVFLDGLPYPTGVTVWRNGVLICTAPDILYAEDTDGDNKADVVEKLYTGFATHNFQARVNSLEYGLDGWLYGSCGLFGGDITCVKTGQVVSLGPRDFRCRPDTGELEPVTGSTQQGRVRNDSGDWFGCDNSTLLVHYPLDDQALRRNPFVQPPRTVVGLAAGPEPGRLYPVSRPVLFALSGPPGRPTAACGLGIYRDDRLGSDFTGNAFTCEPVNNLVHRQLLTPAGTTFVSRRADQEQQSEFLASTDLWFRPVQVRTGLDGAVWVVDMSRYVIEHPVWIPPDRLAQLDSRAGATLGRIWRVVRDPATVADAPPENAGREDQPGREIVQPGANPDRLRRLVDDMETSNGPRRDLVQQMIQWRMDTTVDTQTALIRMVEESARPAVRVQALWTLFNLEALVREDERRRRQQAGPMREQPNRSRRLSTLDPTAEGSRNAPRERLPSLAELVTWCCSDPSPEVRRQAVRIAGRMPERSPELTRVIEAAASDNEALVQLEAIAAATSVDADVAAGMFRSVVGAARGPGNADEFRIATALSSLTRSNVLEVWRSLPEDLVADDSASGVAAQVLASAVGLVEPHAATALLEELAAAATRNGREVDWRRMAVFVSAWRRRPADAFAPDSPLLAGVLDRVVNAAARVSADEAAEVPRRVAALGVLRHGVFLQRPRSESLTALLTARTSPELQRVAAEALLAEGAASSLEPLLSNWAAHSPELRSQIVAGLLTRGESVRLLLTAIESGQLTAADLTLTQQQELLNHPDASLRVRAAELLETTGDPNRSELIDTYLAAAPAEADAGLGRQVFSRHCAACHQVTDSAGTIGHAVGPDVVSYAGKPLSALLQAMLDPERAVDPRYQVYMATLTDGRMLSGLVREETATGFVLINADAKATPVLRGELEELRSSSRSLMPEGLEKVVSPGDAVHLRAWLQSLTVPAKSIPGNSPERIAIPASGAAVLLASQAQIRGGDITFEPPHQNIGMWHGNDDDVRWSIHSDAPREVAVWIEYACDPGAAGQLLELSGGEPALTAVVPSTGAWSQYQLLHVGTTVLHGGESTLRVRPAASLRAALVDLRAVHLVEDGAVPLAAGIVDARPGAAKPANDPATVAALLLDDAQPDDVRQAAIRAHRNRAAELIKRMADGLPEEPGSSEEYRRIPWIWRVAIAAGREGEREVIRQVLETSLPEDGQPFQHWQAVVIGGGLINGLSQRGEWPAESFAEWTAMGAPLATAWQRTLALSSAMADDERVPAGTRYDALRIVALRAWPECREQLTRYVQPGVHDELQMGAVSGLSDQRDPEAAEVLTSGLGHYADENRRLAIAGLLRTPAGRDGLRDALQKNVIRGEQLTGSQRKQLQEHADEPVPALPAGQ